MPAAKRAAPATAAPVEKKAKQDPLMLGVTDAITQAEDVPATCREMLTAAVPSCLGTPSDERHAHQAALVAWMGEVLEGVRSKLHEGLEEADAVEAKAAATKEGLDGKVQEAKASLQEKEEVVVARSASLKDAEEAVVGRKTALAEAEEAQKAGDSSLVEAAAEKKALEDALEQHLKPLKEVEGSQAEETKGHLAVVVPIAKRLALDDSLLLALPAVSARAPSARGAFDCMVLDQLETSLRGQVEKLTGELEAGAPAAAERAAAIASAREELEAAEATQQAAEGALAAAQAALGEAATVLKEAEAAVEAFESGRRAEVKAREEKRFALQNFTGYNLECFASLRDRTACAGA